MNRVFASLALSTLLAGTALAQAPKFILVDVVSKTPIGHMKEDGPKEVHVRMPISLAKGVLEMANSSEVKVNGKTRRDFKVDQLMSLLETAKAGDLLLELTTDRGDLVKITLQ
ncbi:hypothetical protein [Mesoterricola silvestris]|uniref:Uncharacterized protein n=1 Tax=Mesoterricola silvestris TaxID=2927979 RepID=A0AA48GQ84_9BACT|nr:hypothetical protein [Mesoterricola silvestris]BDU72195.1 hypothetical protein METEAL_13690 [Mesoterricola silvestris]